MEGPSDRRRLPPADVRHGRSVMARAATTTTRRRANGKPQVPFVHKLALNQWLLSLFDVKRFEQLAERSEEHTSELQSLMRTSYAVFCLQKKNYLTHNILNTKH